MYNANLNIFIVYHGPCFNSYSSIPLRTSLVGTSSHIIPKP